MPWGQGNLVVLKNLSPNKTVFNKISLTIDQTPDNDVYK